MQIPITVISDCRDDNAKNRVLARLHSLFPGAATNLIGVNDDLDAGGNLTDIVDARDGKEGLVIVNAAPRGGDHGTRWKNGSPFGAVTLDKTLVVATVAGYTLSFAKKLGLLAGIEDLHVFDVQEVLQAQLEQGRFNAEDIARITRTQFRSYEFAPRLAQWLLHEHNLPWLTCPYEIPSSLPSRKVWWVDNFGNVKTTALPNEIGWRNGEVIHSTKGDVCCYNGLKDVPNLEAGLVIGSSGYGQQRFVELVVKGDSAARRFGLAVGDDIF